MMYIRILFFLSLIILGNAFQLTAQEESEKKIVLNGKEYYLHVVRKGEGLYRLGINYGVSQQEILEANDDITENLKIGQIVRIPIISGRNSDDKEINKSRSYIYHTVEKGQTAFFVSRKYNVSLDVIYNNNPGSRERLVEGAILKIPVGESDKEEALSQNAPDDDFIFHTVKPQETLYALSREYNITVEKIKEVNPALQNGVLAIGSKVRIPANLINAASLTRTSEDNTQQFIEGSDYLYHTIQQGQTFYSIARQYQVREQDLHNANPGVTQENLKIGYALRVPRPVFDEKKIAKIDDSDLFTNHKVRRKETLYGISRLYHVDEETIKSLNPTVGFRDLKNGTNLKIPTDAWFALRTATALNQSEDVSVDNKIEATSEVIISTDNCSNTIVGFPIKVALMLPFQSKESNAFFKDSLGLSNESNAVLRPKPFIEFYSGMLLAVDVLKKQGIGIELTTYDIAPDSRSVQNALNDPNLKNMDLIIGPAIANELPLISSFSIEHGIPLVYPMSNSNSHLLDNPYMFHINSPDSLFHDLIADEIVRQARGENLLVILPDSSEPDAVRLAKLVKQKAFLQGRSDNTIINYQEYLPGKDDLLGIQALIDKNKRTYIFMPSKKQADVSKLIPIIAGIKTKLKAEMTLFGMPDWLRFQTIDPENIHVLNGTIFSPFGIDYNDSATKNFIAAYRQQFYTEPYPVSPYFQNSDASASYSRYGIWGYDVSLYFLTAISKYGKNFEACIDNFHFKPIQFNFKFNRISNWGGFYNGGLYMLKFNSDYTTQRIPLFN